MAWGHKMIGRVNEFRPRARLVIFEAEKPSHKLTQAAIAPVREGSLDASNLMTKLQYFTEDYKSNSRK